MSKPLKRDIHPKHQLIYELFERDFDDLYKNTQIYLKKAIRQLNAELGKTFQEPIETLAQEIIGKTLETVLGKAEAFNPELPFRPWFLTFIAYEIKGWKRDLKRKQRRVIHIADLPQARKRGDFGKLSEEEILGLLFQSSESVNSNDRTMLDHLFNLVGEEDRKVLQFAFVDDLNGKSLAAALGITEGAAYQRKSRAIARLRQAYLQAEQEESKFNEK